MSNTTADASDSPLKVLVYSSNRLVREKIKAALGRRIAADLPEITITEFATDEALIRALDAEKFDAAVMDGEAVPGGMGICHQIKDEIIDAPPVVILVARPQDAWLATWSRADAVVGFPIDPLRLPGDVAQVIRDRRNSVVTVLSSVDVVPGVGSRHD